MRFKRLRREIIDGEGQWETNPFWLSFGCTSGFTDQEDASPHPSFGALTLFVATTVYEPRLLVTII